MATFAISTVYVTVSPGLTFCGEKLPAVIVRSDHGSIPRSTVRVPGRSKVLLSSSDSLIRFKLSIVARK